ncbi:MAG: hypothetical protein AB4038_05305 [Prochloraceae cyanobacterium]
MSLGAPIVLHSHPDQRHAVILHRGRTRKVNLDHPLCSTQQPNQSVIQFLKRGIPDGLLRDVHSLLN